MGRVKRYKKLKACDPCAPKRKAEGEEKYDLPPMDSDDEGALVCTGCVEYAAVCARDVPGID